MGSRGFGELRGLFDCVVLVGPSLSGQPSLPLLVALLAMPSCFLLACRPHHTGVALPLNGEVMWHSPEVSHWLCPRLS